MPLTTRERQALAQFRTTQSLQPRSPTQLRPSSFVEGAVVQPLADVGAGIFGAAAGFLESADAVTKVLEERLGIPRGGAFEQLAGEERQIQQNLLNQSTPEETALG